MSCGDIFVKTKVTRKKTQIFDVLLKSLTKSHLVDNSLHVVKFVRFCLGIESICLNSSANPFKSCQSGQKSISNPSNSTYEPRFPSMLMLILPISPRIRASGRRSCGASFQSQTSWATDAFRDLLV